MLSPADSRQSLGRWQQYHWAWSLTPLCVTCRVSPLPQNLLMATDLPARLGLVRHFCATFESFCFVAWRLWPRAHVNMTHIIHV